MKESSIVLTGNHTVFVEEGCMEEFYCCNGQSRYENMVSPGVCKYEHWNPGTLEDGTECTPYSNQCACPPTHAWDWYTEVGFQIEALSLSSDWPQIASI